MSKTSSALFFVITVFCGMPGYSESLPPVVNAGLFVNPEFVSEAGEAVETSWNGGLNAGLGWRSSLDGGGYVSVLSDITGLLVNGSSFQDQEFIRGKAAFPSGPNRIEPEVSLLSSVLGYYASGPFVNPQWNLGYRISMNDEASSVSLVYSGYLALLSESSDDVFREGLRAVLRVDPSIRWALDIGAGGGWELWYETDLFHAGGPVTGQNRQDWILDGNVAMDGLLGYFADWSWETRLTWRSSNANLFLDPDLFMPDTESRLILSIESGIDWSPIRTLGLHVSASAERAWYLERSAFDSEGVLTGEPLRLFDLEGSLRADWTRSHRWYLFLASSGGYTFSNDPVESGWRFSLYSGVELSF